MTNIKIPNIGTDEAVEIIEILVSEGDQVVQEQPLLVLESDKASMEVPSPVAGKLNKLKVKVGDKVKEGHDIAEFEEAAGVATTMAPAKDKKEEAEPEPVAKPAPAKAEEPAKPKPQVDKHSPFGEEGSISITEIYAGPAVRKLAREFGVNLSQVSASGNNNRVILEDVQKFVKSNLARGGGGGAALPPEPQVDFAEFGKLEEMEMDKIKRLTYVGMQTAWLNAPHVTQFDEADVTDLETYRAKQKILAEQKGVKLTPVPFLLKALALGLQEFPQFNVSLKGYTIVQKHYYHIGMAVDTPVGLVVPVIQDVDQKSIWQLATDVMDISTRARNRKLSPKEMQGGCITLSSLGAGGGTQFTPIINLPEVAILGVSRVSKQPVYIGDELQPRLIMPLALSYDHRAVNGVDGAKFVRYISSLLSDLRNVIM